MPDEMREWYLSDTRRWSANDSGDVGVLIEDVDVVIGQNSHDRRLRVTTGRTPCDDDNVVYKSQVRSNAECVQNMHYG